MTMNNNNNNVPSTEGVMLPSHMQQRAALRPPLMSKGLSLLSHSINRKPVRRALVELGRNDRKHNSKLANRLLTISTEEFKQKWNFDPIKMKPINAQGSSTDNTVATTTTIINNNGPKKYEWELVKQTKEQEQEHKDKKELERTVFSLVDRKQMRLSTIAVQVSSQEASPSRIPQLNQQEESVVSSTTEEESAVAQSITGDSSRLESITVDSTSEQQKEEELRKRLTAEASSTAAAATSVVDVPTVTCSTLTNNNNVTQSPRQSKITDFARHHKIVHGPAVKEETDLQPPSKRSRLTC